MTMTHLLLKGESFWGLADRMSGSPTKVNVDNLGFVRACNLHCVVKSFVDASGSLEAGGPFSGSGCITFQREFSTAGQGAMNDDLDAIRRVLAGRRRVVPPPRGAVPAAAVDTDPQPDAARHRSWRESARRCSWPRSDPWHRSTQTGRHSRPGCSLSPATAAATNSPAGGRSWAPNCRKSSTCARPSGQPRKRNCSASSTRPWGALPFEQRSVFVLAHLQGLSYVEVARIEVVGAGTVKSRIARARERCEGQAMQSRSIQGFVPLPPGAMHVKTPKTRKSDWLVVRSDWMPASR